MGAPYYNYTMVSTYLYCFGGSLLQLYHGTVKCGKITGGFLEFSGLHDVTQPLVLALASGILFPKPYTDKLYTLTPKP